MLGYDVQTISDQIQIYQQLEEVKFSTIDAIRYASAVLDVTDEKRRANNEKYAFKLRSLSARFPTAIKQNNLTPEGIDAIFLRHYDTAKKAVTD